MGAAASTIPMQLDKETFRKICGGTINDSIFDAHAVAGIITRDQLMQLASLNDCYISHDWVIDAHGRNNHDRTMAIAQLLNRKNLSIGIDREKPQINLVKHIGNAIDKSRSVVLFLTKSYFDKINGNPVGQNCALECAYALRNKGHNLVIPVIVESQLRDRSSWPDALKRLLAQNKGLVIDMSDDSRIHQSVDELHAAIISATRAPANIRTNLSATIQLPEFVSREEVQLNEWLFRSTKIPENRRTIYCYIFICDGATSVSLLSEKMKSNSNYLLASGVFEPDADEIALAVGDLGFGFTPVRDFTHGESPETVTYALNKASQSPGDHALTANAFNSVARVASTSEAAAIALFEAGVCPAIGKLITHHIADANAVFQAFNAIKYICRNPAIVETLVSYKICDIIPRATQTHMKNASVCEVSCQIVTIIAYNKENRYKFGISSACEVITQMLLKHVDNAKVCMEGCKALNQLTNNNLENIGRFGPVCKVLPKVVQSHIKERETLGPAFRSVVQLSLHADNRADMGENGICKAIVEALQNCGGFPLTVEQGSQAIDTLITGSAINRKRFGDAGAVELYKALLMHYYNNSNENNCLFGICAVCYALIAGNMDNQIKLNDAKPVFLAIANNNDNKFAENLRNIAREVGNKLV